MSRAAIWITMAVCLGAASGLALSLVVPSGANIAGAALVTAFFAGQMALLEWLNHRFTDKEDTAMDADPATPPTINDLDIQAMLCRESRDLCRALEGTIHQHEAGEAALLAYRRLEVLSEAKLSLDALKALKDRGLLGQAVDGSADLGQLPADGSQVGA